MNVLRVIWFVNERGLRQQIACPYWNLEAELAQLRSAGYEILEVV